MDVAKTISIAALSSEVSKILNDYVDEVADGTDEAVTKVANQCLKEIKAASPVKTGRYRKGWKKKQTSSGRGKLGYTLYNERPGLPHLLEKGHAKVNGGRVAGIPHIAPAAEKAVRDLQQRVEEVVKNASN